MAVGQTGCPWESRAGQRGPGRALGGRVEGPWLAAVRPLFVNSAEMWRGRQTFPVGTNKEGPIGSHARCWNGAGLGMKVCDSI